ncbi:unnamed protein product [Agarophyton chilense]
MLSNTISATQSLNQLNTAIQEEEVAKTSAYSKRSLSAFSLGLIQARNRLPLPLFDFCISNHTRINLYLSDVYVTHAPSKSSKELAHPLLLAVRVSCKTHLQSLPPLLFGALSAVGIGDRSALLHKFTGTSDMNWSEEIDVSVIRQLCRLSSSSLRTLQLIMPVSNSARACHVLQLLSSSLCFASRVSTLHLSADIRPWRMGHPRWKLCPASNALSDAINAIRSFREELPHVQMPDFAELLELSVSSSDCI